MENSYRLSGFVRKKLLRSNGDLDLQTVFLFDKVQKYEVISKESYKILKKQGIVEGRYPNIYIVPGCASAAGRPFSANMPAVPHSRERFEVPPSWA